MRKCVWSSTSPQRARHLCVAPVERHPSATFEAMFKFLAIALCLALGAAEEEAAKDKVGDVIGIDLGTTYSCGERAGKVPWPVGWLQT